MAAFWCASKNLRTFVIIMDIDLILKYFPGLSDRQVEQLRVMCALYPEWNARINVISRKDIDNLVPAHILHSLAIAAFLGPLEAGTTVMDLGTGGGFPGIPGRDAARRSRKDCRPQHSPRQAPRQPLCQRPDMPQRRRH